MGDLVKQGIIACCLPMSPHLQAVCGIPWCRPWSDSTVLLFQWAWITCRKSKVWQENTSSLAVTSLCAPLSTVWGGLCKIVRLEWSPIWKVKFISLPLFSRCQGVYWWSVCGESLALVLAWMTFRILF